MRGLLRTSPFRWVVLACWFTAAGAQATAAMPVDRVIVRYSAPETGGVRFPRFIFERELAFEARLEASADVEFAKASARPYLERHVQAALERSIGETLLASLRVDPSPSEREIVKQASAARRILLDRIGGQAALDSAMHVEGIGEGDVSAIFRRRARAAIYLDRMVSPMLTPTVAELRQVYSTQAHPYHSIPFDKAKTSLQRWVIGRKLREAVDQYYQNARQRLAVVQFTS